MFKKTGHWLFLCLFFSAGPARVIAGDVASTELTPAHGSVALNQATFLARRDAVRQAVWADYQAKEGRISSHNAFFTAEILFDLGKITEGRHAANLGLDALEPGNKINRWIYGGNSGFLAWPGIDLYIGYNSFFDDALKTRFARIYQGAVWYHRLTTSNHVLMAAVTRYLATQTWGENFKPDPLFKPETYSGSMFTADDPTGEKQIRKIIANNLRSSFGEYASRPYGAQNILPLLTLAQRANDPGIRESARMAYEYNLAQLAGTYLRGHLATFSVRSYPDVISQTPFGITGVVWAYCGGVPPDKISEQWALRAFVGDYVPPALIIKAATDRSHSYTQRSIANGWRLTNWMDQTYALFSRSPKGDPHPPVVLGQNYPCGVTWEDPDTKKDSFLWVTNPAADNNGTKNNAPNGIHTHGTTKAQQQVQVGGTSLSVFNIPADFRNPYVLGYIPGGALAVINRSKEEGRIFLHYPGLLIALTSSQPFDWNPASGILAPAATPGPGDSEFRVRAAQAGFVIETARPDEFTGDTSQSKLEAFAKAVTAHGSVTIKTSPQAALVTATYTDHLGHQLQCAFDGKDQIDGQPVDYEKWPALNNPWMQQEKRGENLTLTDGTATQIEDLAAAIQQVEKTAK
jgi:hypothetical protein